jgi:hypothetical protein
LTYFGGPWSTAKEFLLRKCIKTVQVEYDSDEESDAVNDENSVLADEQQDGLGEWLGGVI